MNIQCRPETSEDFPAIDDIHRAAFDNDYEPRIVALTRSLPEALPELSIVAILEGQVVGHVLLSVLHHESPAWDGLLLGLGPIGVAPEKQRSGIGSQLMKHAIERAAALGYRGIILLGDPAYYSRFAFRPASTWGIRLPYPVPDENAMALPLGEDALEGAAGLIRYSSAFDPI